MRTRTGFVHKFATKCLNTKLEKVSAMKISWQLLLFGVIWLFAIILLKISWKYSNNNNNNNITNSTKYTDKTVKGFINEFKWLQIQLKPSPKIRQDTRNKGYSPFKVRSGYGKNNKNKHICECYLLQQSWRNRLLKDIEGSIYCNYKFTALKVVETFKRMEEKNTFFQYHKVLGKF